MTDTAPRSTSPELQPQLIQALSIAAFNGCEKSQDTLILQLLHFLTGILKGYRITGEVYNDCKSEATLALIKAVRSFNPYRGYSISSYVSWFIHAAIKKALRETNLISIPKNKWYHVKSEQESAARPCTTVATLSKPQLPQTNLFSEIQYQPDNISASSRETGPAGLAERSYLKRAICEGLDQLSDFEKQVISERYGIYQEKPVSSRELALKLNCSRSAILKAEESAKRSLRHFFENKGLRSFIGGE